MAVKRPLLTILAVAIVGGGAFARVVLRDDAPDKCRTTERGPDGSTQGICPDGTRFNGAPVGSDSPKPEPSPTTLEFRSEQAGKYRYRVWPRSEDVPNEGSYRFTVPHCGLEWMTDFDGSFWRIVDRKSYGKHGPSFFINGDQGILTFEDEDSIVYRASTVEEVQLRRLPGPTIIQLCA
jgi:hypothetical protein